MPPGRVNGRTAGNGAWRPAPRAPPDPGGPHARYRAPWPQRPRPHRPPAGHLREASERFQAAAADVTAAPDAWILAVGGALAGLGDAWPSTWTSPRPPTACSTSCSTTRSRWRPRSTTSGVTTRPLVAAMTRARELLASPTAGPDDTKLLQSLAGIAKQVDQHRAGAPTCSTRSTASTSPPATDGGRSGARPTRVRPRPSARLSGCESSGASRSSTCAASRA